jgi:hypothetical protein
MNHQTLLFDVADNESTQKYCKKIEAPIYEPSHEQPHIMTLCDTSKTNRLIREIDSSNLPEDEKAFLRLAAQRHSVFNYERIADYYAHATPQMQRLMEDSALVIIDFNRAIELGYVKLCEDIRKQYFEEYSDNDETT